MSDAAAPLEDKLETCFRVVEARCAAAGITVARLPDAPEMYLALELSGGTRPWQVEVSCRWPKYSDLPFVRLRGNRELLAHVLYPGGICVDDSQGLSMDLEARDDVVAHTVVLAWKLLEASAADAQGDMSEFFNELGAYWAMLPKSLLARSAVDGLGNRRLVVHRLGAGESASWYFVERGVSPPPEFELWLKKALALRGALFELPQPVLPPRPGETLSADLVKEVVAAFNPEQTAVWKDLVGPSMNGPREIALLLSMPRKDGTRTHLGIACHVTKGIPDTKKPVYPLDVIRHTPEYMRERGGANEALYGKHIVVFGCGSVGSEVADAIASAGVGKLTLVDTDVMSPDNVYRHLLGRKSVGFLKVVGCAVELESKYPQLRVAGIRQSAEEWLENADLAEVDGVVVAVGVPTLERALARKLRAFGKELPVVTTWLEPLDLGGHSVAVRTSGTGCLDCLYRDDEGLPSLMPRTAFLAAGQKVSRNLTGCASVFVPYGAIQSRRTALMAAEHMLDCLTDGALPSYRYWTGAGKEASAQYLKTTPWWSMSRSTPMETATEMLFGEPCARCRAEGAT